ncbi:MAG: cation transporter [Chlorobi bacterium]|nr:cation transporter [Chlorobiota bacterium]
MNKKVKTARLSIFSNLFLIVIKIVVGILSGSVSIISEAIHSTIDLVASVIAFFSVKVSGLPPDKEHPYGHGKIENISGVVEGLLILVAAFWIVYEAIKKFVDHKPIDFLYLGIIVMSVSAIVNFFVSRRLYKVAKETDSIALEADALHLKTDIYTSVGVAIGMFIIWLTDLHVLDPVIAILVALIILKEAYSLIRNAYQPLVDVALPDEDLKLVDEILSGFMQGEISYHKVRSRKSGPYKYLDFHLNVPGDMSVKESHNLCDKIELGLKSKIAPLDINIHVEPAKSVGKLDVKA